MDNDYNGANRIKFFTAKNERKIKDYMEATKKRSHKEIFYISQSMLIKVSKIFSVIGGNKG